MHCHNCGNVESFVLVLECAVELLPGERLENPSWGVFAQCPACASTDVAGEPLAHLAEYAGRTGQ